MKLTIRRLFKIKSNKVAFFIDSSVLLLAYVVDKKLKNLLLLQGLHGIELMLTDGVQIAVKGVIVVGLMALILALQPFIMIPILLLLDLQVY